MSIFNDRYIFIHDNKASKDFISLISCTKRGAELVKRDGDFGYRVGVDGNNVGRVRSWFDALARVRQLLRTKGTGHEIVLQRVRLQTNEVGDQVRFRHVLRKPPVLDTPGPLGMDRVRGFIESKFPKARFAGQCVCKPDSDHAFCSAVDYFDTEANMVAMRVALLANATFFDIKYIILFDRIWFADGSSHAYTGDFHAHIHVSVNEVGPSAC